MMNKGMCIAGLVMLLAASALAQVPIPDPLPAFDFTFSPSNPTSQSTVQLSIGGLWPNSCVPNSATVFVNGSQIEVALLLPGAIDCNEPNCTPTLGTYGITTPVGPLAPGPYTVLLRIVSCTEATEPQFLGSFTVGIPTGNGEPNVPVQVGPGTCVVLLEDFVCDTSSLRAGQAGIVVCCDSADCSGRLRVSWFLHTQGTGTSDDCVNDTPRAVPPASSTWVDPRQVGLGVCFDRCGVLGQNDEGCFVLEGDDGRTYILVAGSWLPQFLGPDGEFELGDRVRVRGIVNIMRPADDFFACSEQDGDIFNPVLTPCTPSGGNGDCCAANYQPGDRVRLLVNNPPDMIGRPAPGLPAGTLGTVLCCNTDDEDFTVYVSWDNFTGGFNQDVLCDVPPINHPAGSTWWVDCDDIVRAAGNGNGDPCPADNLTIGFGDNGIQLFRDPQCPTTPRNFFGCVNVTVTTNFRARLSLNITPVAGINGTWQGTITPEVVPAGQSSVQVCINAEGVNLSAIPAGQNVQVAQVSILAVPEPAP